MEERGVKGRPFRSQSLRDQVCAIAGPGLSRAEASRQGNTVDFLLTAKRDRKAAVRFLRKAVGQHGTPAKITIDGSGANTAAI